MHHTVPLKLLFFFSLHSQFTSLSPLPPSPPIDDQSPLQMTPQPTDLPSLQLQLHKKANVYAHLGLTDTARFYVDKVLTSSDKPKHILYQARLFYQSQQYRRSLSLLQAHNLQVLDAEARLLAAQCLFQLSDFEQCISVLGDEDHQVDTGLAGRMSREVSAALCVLRAHVYQRMENPPRAILWYKRALRCDIYCVEAFIGISQTSLVSADDALNFIKELTAKRTDDNSHLYQWLSTYYRCATDRTAPIPSAPNAIDQNIDIKAVQARRAYDALDFTACVNICRQIIAKDPFAEEPILLVYLAALVELDERQELFATAHKLVDRQPKNGLSWLAVGYYYFAVGKPDAARRFLQKSTTLNPRLAAAWVAFGHAFGAQDESDQAMASYRTASRLFPGAQLPMLFMGMEYMRQNSLSYASMLFQDALAACPADPAPRHELGVVAYRSGDHARAVAYFKTALSLWEVSNGAPEASYRGGRRAEAEEATLLNLGHCYRRLREFPRAKRCYERALALAPRNASTCAALGMTLHAMWDVDAAVAMYHRALRYSPEDANCSELLERALFDWFSVKPAMRKSGVGAIQGLGEKLDTNTSVLQDIEIS